MSSRRRIPPRFSVMMAIIAFIVAAIPACGIVMKDDRVGRTIFTSVWLLIAIAWLGCLVTAKAAEAEE